MPPPESFEPPKPPDIMDSMLGASSWRRMIASNCEAAFLIAAGSRPEFVDFEEFTPVVAKSARIACIVAMLAAVEVELLMAETLMLVDHEFGLERAGAFERLKNRHHFPGGNP